MGHLDSDSKRGGSKDASLPLSRGRRGRSVSGVQKDVLPRMPAGRPLPVRMERKGLLDRQRLIRTPWKHNEILIKLEHERFARQLQDLNRQFDNLREHINSIVSAPSKPPVPTAPTKKLKEKRSRGR